MNTYNKVNTFLNGKIEEMAQKLGYPASTVLALQRDLEAIKVIDEEQYNRILSCKYLADKRTLIDYARDIVASWVFEDYIFETLKNNTFSIELAGADKLRKFLSSSKTSAQSDFLIKYNGVSIKLELMSDYTGYWHKQKRIDLRDAKYNKLIKEQSLFLGLCVLSGEFTLIDFRNPPPAKYIASQIVSTI